MLTLTPPRIHRRLVIDPFRRLQETLDEIHEDFFSGRLTQTQRVKYENEAFHDLGKAKRMAEELEAN